MAVESNRFSNFKCGDDRSLKLNGILAHGLPTVWLTVTALMVRHTSTAPITAILTCHIIFRCMQLGDNRNKDLGWGGVGAGEGGDWQPRLRMWGPYIEETNLGWSNNPRLGLGRPPGFLSANGKAPFGGYWGILAQARYLFFWNGCPKLW